MDTIETIEGALVQHGPHNDRIYVMKVPRNGGAKVTALLEKVDILAREGGYGKVFARIPETVWPDFEKAGYHQEAVVPGLFPDGSACVFIARFYDARRAVVKDAQRLQEVMAACSLAPDPGGRSLEPSMEIHGCTPQDAREMSSLFRAVFTTYPFPIHDPGFLKTAMEEGTLFLGGWQQERLVALASLEPDTQAAAAEMGDFATLSQCRGMGLASQLLIRLDRLACEMGLTTTFTIARARSFGMNRVFSRCGYRHAGLLVNNTQIAGSIQSMNVWYKHPGKQEDGRTAKTNPDRIPVLRNDET